MSGAVVGGREGGGRQDAHVGGLPAAAPKPQRCRAERGADVALLPGLRTSFCL